MADAKWYLVDSSSGQPVGPYDVKWLQGLISSGHLRLETPIWCEGQPEWFPLKDVPELAALGRVAKDLANKAAKAAAAEGPADELEAFQAEIDQIEAQAAGEVDGGDGTRTPEELEFEDDDGTVYVWDKQLRKYMPKTGDGVPSGDFNEADMVFVPEEEVIPSLAVLREAEEDEGADDAIPAGKGRKRPAPSIKEPQPDADAAAAAGTTAAPNSGSNNKGLKGKKGASQGKQQAQQPQGWFELKNNTSIYIQGLPDDVTVEEVHEACTKFGLVKEDDQRRPRIKLYRDRASGALKGDCLVTFLKEPSVALAVNLLDGTSLRPGGPTMAVQPAKFEQKGDTYVAKQTAANKKARKAVLEKQEKRLTWGGLDDKLPPEKVTVVLRHMFRPAQMAAAPSAAAELEEDVKTEAAKFGPVEKIRVFKEHPHGVVSVKFKTEEGAKACLAKMHGRFFDGQQIAASMWDGVTNLALEKYKETPEEEQARLEAYARELEAKQQAGAGAGGDAAAAAPVQQTAPGSDSGTQDTDMQQETTA